MDDGGMGSLLFDPDCPEERRLGEQISEGVFFDIDGVEVSVALNVDNLGALYELDVWKVTFEKTIQLPDDIREFKVTGPVR
ncbi:hypothetical protein DFP90_102121 [Aestuariispira insulae]|uniref:DUF6984 domain-containing protein n=2 Tax=Aestuariispira insulae TaxID=1461337 RepID=A0A3D9HRG6_9PROT|nr:hypothetical protein [Aestuariispira insulae]RED52103.1 hypothetical protein DFP90_102121 [Aestuariispira insulae]